MSKNKIKKYVQVKTFQSEKTLNEWLISSYNYIEIIDIKFDDYNYMVIYGVIYFSDIEKIK